VKTTPNTLKDFIIMVVCAFLGLVTFWAIFSIFTLLDPSYGYYHPEVLP